MGNEVVERHVANGFIDMPEEHKAFAVEYITNGFKHLDAAEAVGLSRSLGLTRLRDPLIGAFITHLQSASQIGKLITQEFVESKYLEILPKLMGEEEVDIVDAKEGGSFKAKKFHGPELVSVLSHLGKSSGYIAPDVGGGSGGVNVQINLGDLAGDDPIQIQVIEK